MSTKIEVQGWRKEDGPVYTRTTRKTGFGSRRKGAQVEQVGKPGGRYYEQPATALVDGGRHPALLLNKGHEYQATFNLDGDQFVARIDARDEYVIFTLKSGISFVSAEAYEKPEEQEEKEDQVEGEAEDASETEREGEADDEGSD